MSVFLIKQNLVIVFSTVLDAESFCIFFKVGINSLFADYKLGQFSLLESSSLRLSLSVGHIINAPRCLSLPDALPSFIAFSACLEDILAKCFS